MNDLVPLKMRKAPTQDDWDYPCGMLWVIDNGDVHFLRCKQLINDIHHIAHWEEVDRNNKHSVRRILIALCGHIPPSFDKILEEA